MFKSIAERDAWISKNAKYWTAVRHKGPGLGYERHEFPSKEKAICMAQTEADILDKSFLIYAVGPNDESAFIQGVFPTEWRKP